MAGRGSVPGAGDDREVRDARSYDFGGMIRRMPAAVAMPESVEEASSIVRRAATDGVRLAIRGSGHSQGGQCLADGGLVLDTARLDRVRLLGPDLVRAQGGAQWGRVVDALRGTGRLPRVLADIAEVTVGGTLSAGGLGTTSHRHGLQIGQVEQLDVVIGTGERVRCSRTRNADLFDAVRGGQGQFGLIVDAWIRLRRAGARIRQYGLRYRGPDRFAHDLQRVVEDGRFDHLRAETLIHDREVLLSAGVEYEDEPDDAEVLRGLGHDEIATVRDNADTGRATMFPIWGFIRNNHHPWRDWLVPWEALRALLAQPWLDEEWVPRAPGSWVGMYPIGAGAVDAPLLMRPKGERMLSYSILAVLRGREKARELAGRLEEVDRAIVDLGGKSYLSGRVGYGREEWREHYGEMLDTGLGWKRAFDPERVFRWEGMPFAEDAAPTVRSTKRRRRSD